MIFKFSFDASSAAVAAAVFLAAAPINANRFPLELRKGNVEEPLSTEKNPYIPRKLGESNGNDDLDVHKEGIKRSLSMENKIWPATRGYQPTIKNSFRAPQTDNNKATVWSRDAHLWNTPIVDLGILDKGFGRTDVDVPAITNADRERDEAEALAASSSLAFTGYFEASSSDTSTSYQNDDPLGNPTTSARSLSDDYCYEKCGDPSQRPIVTDSTIKNAIKECKYDNTSSDCPYPNIEMQCWNTSTVTNSGYFFRGSSNFNEPLGCWDVSSVTAMYGIFQNAKSFNQNINRWEVSAVTDMAYMFFSSVVFNQPLEDWNTSSVKNMQEMFSYAEKFNQPIGDWDVSSVTKTYAMFSQAKPFNQPLDWDLSSVTNSYKMFFGTTFNQCISTYVYPKSEILRNSVDMFEFTKCPDYSSFTSVTESPTTNPTESPTDSPDATESPTDSPTENPTNNPTITGSPTDTPIGSPAPPNCRDNPNKIFEIEVDGVTKTDGDCAWLALEDESKRIEYCGDQVEVNGDKKKLSGICKETCGLVGFGKCTPKPTSAPSSGPKPDPVVDCEDKTKKFQISIDGTDETKRKDCTWLALRGPSKKKKFCRKSKVKIYGGDKALKVVCKTTCGEVGIGPCAFLADSVVSERELFDVEY